MWVIHPGELLLLLSHDVGVGSMVGEGVVGLTMLLSLKCNNSGVKPRLLQQAPNS